MSQLLSLFSIARAYAVTISMGVPGNNANSSTTSPGAFVANIYQFALAIAGVLAFGIIVYGGVKYMTSSGNPSGQSDAKEWIEAALLGILLLVGAYFILNIVNPQLVDLTLPTIQPVNIQAGAGAGCGGLSCPSGSSAVSTGVGSSCSCETTSGQTTCGGATSGACGNGQTCIQTQSNPITYACQSSSNYDCGKPASHLGACANPYVCSNDGTQANPIYTCSLLN